MASLNEEYPPEFSDERSLALVSDIIDWQINHGSLLKHMDPETRFPDDSPQCYPVGITIFPTLFPREHFDRACELQTIYNELYCAMAEDERWIFEAIRDLIPVDPLAAALWGIHEEVKKVGYRQRVSVGIFRSDYMLDGPGVEFPLRPGENFAGSLKQVEFNTFSCAGATHANKAVDMHRYFARTNAYDPGDDRLINVALAALPHNNTIASLSACLAAAHDAYQPRKGQVATETAVLFVVQPNNFNIADERPLEYALWNHDPPIPAYRVDYPNDFLQYTTLTESRVLLFHPPWLGSKCVEISVAYMRAGYEAHEYDTTGREARLRIELSMAIKCPSLLAHICTFKKVQCALTTPGALEHFISPAKAALIRSTFVSMYPLDDSEVGSHARHLATDPELSQNYILKPSLEGGGHNIFGEDIPGFLAAIPQSQWSAYILMERIRSPSVFNVLLSSSGLDSGGVISELGIFGTCLWRDGTEERPCEMLQNSVGGWSFKTKHEEVNEMSVVKGYGCFDTPLLF
ncbi:hypothetical protein BDV26DRAFT_56202 [Aspergillus bertholletiae]|uniref:Glutathione synthetase n=1 Tax=Aspergillus bertholletiae TaxID=1226010 RepID=A0A5N7BJD8_9EURO|nr:hypothetical protein BDV26DRAFT_56202 [Aspergillus bertholletiae]